MSINVQVTSPALFLCVVTAGPGGMAGEEDFLAVIKKIRRKHKATCYSDERIAIFSANDSLPVVAAGIAAICGEHGLGHIVVEATAQSIVAPAVDMVKCFGDRTLTVSRNLGKALQASRPLQHR